MASVMVERAPSAHAKLHKRNASDFTPRLSHKSPTMPSPAVLRPSLDFQRKVIYEEPQPAPGTGLKIKQYSRRPSAKDGGIVDLSRSAAENETLAGLGLGLDNGPYNTTYTFGGAGNASDVSFTPIRHQRHRRSTSGNSHISTNSNGLRQQPSTYVHPLRQTPRPYTPPISMSYTSTAGSGNSSQVDVVEHVPRPADEAEALRRLATNTSSDVWGRGSESFTQFPSLDKPPPLQLRTSDVSEHFMSPSQTSLPGGRRSRGTTMQSIDTASPSSRPSLDRAIQYLRGQRGGSATDTEYIDNDASRAATIRAARQAYQEREHAKERKAEKEELRQAEREQRKQERKEDRKRRRSEGAGRPPHVDEKDDAVGGAEYATLGEGDDMERRHPQGLGGRQNTSASNRSRVKTRGPKSTWAVFLAWFRTRLLRMGR